MYKINKRRLTNKSVEKDILVIEFNDPSMAIVGEFLMSDSTLLGGSILKEIDLVLYNERDYIESSGNRCAVKISAEDTVIEDLYTNISPDFDSLPSYTIKTSLLKELIVMWHKELANVS